MNLKTQLQEEDLKKEIRKLESSDSFHADFTRSSSATRDGKRGGSPGVSVKELCRKTRFVVVVVVCFAYNCQKTKFIVIVCDSYICRKTSDVIFVAKNCNKNV